ncbi:LysR family transcriptional regulator [Streptomyces rubradiris]|uniref:LysR family transcriptional regulator n=1 Tax=Streptomyces rubradiris TaxID=285531 RepID=A0ABQ3R858_STRRR|nr:LysR family transcriptional regulator [Streptomyces rubradiris]GHH31272.1 LysR family transcriptional regulator [Streptomyces rubradiris]GHI52042.1 LysR family transcriptional regulator [Streptomyces rubradiris]
MEGAPDEIRSAAEADGLALPGGDRDPSTHQLRLFLALAQELHFGRAAARLFMAQPTLSKQIRLLESKLGVILLDRTSRAVALTPAGRALIPEAQEAVRAMARLRQRAAEHSRQVRGHLVLGFIAGEAAMPYTHAILDELHRRQPCIQVELRALSFGNQFQALANGDVDAALLRHPLPRSLRTIRLATEPRVACIPASDRLAALQAERPVTLMDLADYLVVDMPTQAPRDWWDSWAVNPRPDGSSVEFGPVAENIEGLLHIIARAHAFSFLPAAARLLYPRPGIAYLDVADAPPSTAALAWMPTNRDRPTLAALLDITRRVTGAAGGLQAHRHSGQ